MRIFKLYLYSDKEYICYKSGCRIKLWLMIKNKIFKLPSSIQNKVDIDERINNISPNKYIDFEYFIGLWKIKILSEPAQF